jgi:hypothetical protein
VFSKKHGAIVSHMKRLIKEKVSQVEFIRAKMNAKSWNAAELSRQSLGSRRCITKK